MKKKIVTHNKEIYDKFNTLFFVDEIVLKTVKPYQIDRIVNNINKTKKYVELEKIGNYYLLRKIRNFDFSIYKI